MYYIRLNIQVYLVNSLPKTDLQKCGNQLQANADGHFFMVLQCIRFRLRPFSAQCLFNYFLTIRHLDRVHKS